jgi:uncharacterized membrane protein
LRNNRFSISETIRYGWNTVKDNLRYFIIVMLIMALLQLIISASRWSVRHSLIGLDLLVGIIGIILSAFLSMAVIRIGLRFTAGDKAEYRDLYAAYRSFWRFLGGYILYVLIIVGGLILLIIPGIIWAVKYQFFGYFMIDQDMTPRKALKRSGQITNGIKGYLFLFNLAMLGIIILGYLALIVGILVAGPLVWISMAYVYRVLLATETIHPIAANS